jgi:hypothetical protein
MIGWVCLLGTCALIWFGLAYLGWRTGWWTQIDMCGQICELIIRIVFELLSSGW